MDASVAWFVLGAVLGLGTAAWARFLWLLATEPAPMLPGGGR